jgi:hypothetical protein
LINLKSTMEQLPIEIIVEIANHLSLHSLEEFGKTSKTNMMICEYVWKDRYHDILGYNGYYKSEDNKKDVYYERFWYLKYSFYLKSRFVFVITNILEEFDNVKNIDEKCKVINNLFDYSVIYKDFITYHKSLRNFKHVIEKKLDMFMFPTDGDNVGSIKEIDIAHKYYPILFKNEYVIKLLFFDNQFKKNSFTKGEIYIRYSVLLFEYSF